MSVCSQESYSQKRFAIELTDFGSGGGIIERATVLNLLDSEKELFVKVAVDSGGGHGIFYINNLSHLHKVLDNITSDVIIQRPLKQHKVLASLNPSSVNTLRILSMLQKNGVVKIYSAILRMGVGNTKVDNASSGGITCGITESGRLKGIAYNASGDIFSVHPTSGISFGDIVLPNYTEAVEMVEACQRMLPDFRLVSWDIAINDDGHPVLIEVNLKYGELDFHQLNNGPVFGKDTELIMKEIFNRRLK